MQTTNGIRRFVWLVALLLLALPLAPTAPRSQAATVRTQTDWGQMPLYSVANQGQNVELVGQLGGGVGAVVFQDPYAYITVGPRLVILDVSDPAQPAFVGQTGILPDALAGDLALAGNYVYVAERMGLDIINVANPPCGRLDFR